MVEAPAAERQVEAVLAADADDDEDGRSHGDSVVTTAFAQVPKQLAAKHSGGSGGMPPRPAALAL